MREIALGFARHERAAPNVGVLVVKILRVIMHMIELGVNVGVAVLARDRWFVDVLVVAVVVPVRVLVGLPNVSMAVGVLLGPVQHDGEGEERSGQRVRGSRRRGLDDRRHARAHERREREERSRSTRTQDALRAKIEEEARTVAEGAGTQQSEPHRGARPTSPEGERDGGRKKRPDPRPHPHRFPRLRIRGLRGVTTGFTRRR